MLAAILTFLRNIINNIVVRFIIRISMKAAIGFCIPKYKMVHSAFARRLILNSTTSVLFWEGLAFCHEMNSEIAMSKYNSVQTGPNTASGGVILGFMDLYHAVSVVTNTDPRIPGRKTSPKQNSKINHSFLFIVYSVNGLFKPLA